MESTLTIQKGSKAVSSEQFYAVVKGKDSADDTRQWKEVGEIVSISGNGAGFYLERECRVGQLISMLLPLEPELRMYDQDKELYKVWGVVQLCSPHKTPDAAKYHIGVAFIGKEIPASYKKDPRQNYRICGTVENGLWKIEEARKPFSNRKEMRYWNSFEVYLAIADGPRKGARSTTENVSKSGAAVISNLALNVGDRVKFISEQFNFSGIAVVLERNYGEDKRPRLHLQFVENTFPVELLKTAIVSS